MPFRQYTKIHRLGVEENEGILEGNVWVQEKVDGANTSIWLEDGEVKCGNKNHLLHPGTDFNGFVVWATTDPEVRRFLTDHPDHRLYGEWLVRHSIPYREGAYRKFYAFDIEREGSYIPLTEFFQLLEGYDINQVYTFGCLANPSLDQLKEYLGKSTLGEKGEGIVLKNDDYVNKFLHKNYAKLVTEEFMEANAIVFGGNNKHSPQYWEQYVVNKYLDLPRVQKVVHKIESATGKKPDLSWTPRVTNTVYHDLLTEEIWEISKKVHSLNFSSLKRIAMKKAAMVFKDILSDQLSVAYNPRENGENSKSNSVPVLQVGPTSEAAPG